MPHWGLGSNAREGGTSWIYTGCSCTENCSSTWFSKGRLNPNLVTLEMPILSDRRKATRISVINTSWISHGNLQHVTDKNKGFFLQQLVSPVLVFWVTFSFLKMWVLFCADLAPCVLTSHQSTSIKTTKLYTCTIQEKVSWVLICQHIAEEKGKYSYQGDVIFWKSISHGDPDEKITSQKSLVSAS